MNVHSENRKAASSAAAKRRRGRPLVDDKRRIILDAALGVFAKKGYHGTSVPEVAEASGVGTGTLYRYFENKEALVNEVYRDAKLRLRAALLDGVPEPAFVKRESAEQWFTDLWQRLGAFAKAEPEAFRFLEMQDHVEYLDRKSRQLELSVLMPLLFAGQRLASGRPPTAPLRRERSFRNSEEAAAAVDAGDGRAVPVAVLMALLWGAFVGLVKASRLGYLPLDDKKLAQAGTACWRLIAPELSRSRTRTKGT